MCVAILQPVGKRLLEPTLRKCFAQNPDGSGMAFVEDGEVVIRKGYMKVESFLAAYDEYMTRFGDKSPFLIHFRVATKGKITEDNCHPFKIKGGAMIHNGTLWYSGQRHDEKSDTREFAEAMHNNLHKGNVLPRIKEISGVLTPRNKIAILYKNKETALLNHDGYDAFWDDGVWFSNNHWKHTQSYHHRGY